ncbi:MAG: hypothetical protein CSH37_09905 [Thalassolituus sp.]|nr:MAG: hypothetical protein CSH37_09905 [Thalassolituus sp.]
MLNKFAVPGFEYVTAFLPIKNKLGHCILNKLRVDAGPLQNLQGVTAWLPIRCNGECFFLGRLKPCPFLLTTKASSIVLRIYPLILYEAEESCVPVVAVRALFLPL